jgi:hypothetical protein
MWTRGEKDPEKERIGVRQLRDRLSTGRPVREYCFRCCGETMFGKRDYFCGEDFKFLAKDTPTGELPSGSVRFLTPDWTKQSCDSRCGKARSRCERMVGFLCKIEKRKILAQIKSGQILWHPEEIPDPKLIVAAIKRDGYFEAATDWVSELDNGMNCHVLYGCTCDVKRLKGLHPQLARIMAERRISTPLIYPCRANGFYLTKLMDSANADAAEKFHQAFDSAGSKSNSYIKWNCCCCLKRWKDFKRRIMIIGESDVSCIMMPEDDAQEPDADAYMKRMNHQKPGHKRAAFYAFVGDVNPKLENMMTIMKGAPLLLELPPDYWGMDTSQHTTRDVMLEALERVCKRTGDKLSTLPEKTTIYTASVENTRDGVDHDKNWPETWDREIVGDSPTLSQLHEGTKMDVLLLDGDLMPTLSDHAMYMILAQCMMFMDTKALIAQAEEKGYGKSAKTPKTIAQMHEMALQAREVLRPELFKDPNYQPKMNSCL